MEGAECDECGKRISAIGCCVSHRARILALESAIKQIEAIEVAFAQLRRCLERARK